MTSNGRFSWEDMAKFVEEGGFARSDPRVSLDAVSATIYDPVMDDGTEVVGGVHDLAIEQHLLSEYAKATAPFIYDAGMRTAAMLRARREEVEGSALAGAFGYGVDQYRMAKDAEEAGDPSAMLSLYSGFLERM